MTIALSEEALSFIDASLQSGTDLMIDFGAEQRVVPKETDEIPNKLVDYLRGSAARADRLYIQNHATSVQVEIYPNYGQESFISSLGRSSR